MKRFLLLIIALSASHLSNAQSNSDWKAYTSFRNVTEIETDNEGRLWTSTDGGVLITDQGETVKSLTPIDGLTRLDGSAIIYDAINERIIIGYITGEIDVIDAKDYSVTRINDIARNITFSQKAINDFFITNESLFVATNFGLVEFNLNTFFVRDSYIKFGTSNSGIAVYDFAENNDTLYIGTDEGIAYSFIDGNYDSDEWLNYNETNGFINSAIYSVGVSEVDFYASSASENYRFENNNWFATNDFSSNVILDYFADESKLIAISEDALYYKEDMDSFFQLSLENNVGSSLLKNTNSGNNVIFGTRNNGIGELDLEDKTATYIIPEGPFGNFFDGLNFDGSILISGSTQKSSGSAEIDKGRGFYIFDNNEWSNFNELITPELSANTYRQAFRTTKTEDFYYFGSWGTGVVRYEKDSGIIKIFDETNSTLRGWSQDSDLYPVISGLETDSQDDVWIVSRYGDTPLYRQTPGENDWQAFDESNAANSSDLYEGLFIDSFDQKWIPIQNAQASGTGLIVINTGNSSDPQDDIGIKLQSGSNSGNLPDNKVNTLIEDKNGEVWIGTSRGIARFIFPELIVEGSTQERNAQWLINEDTSAVSRFLLRDVNATSMAVNAANEKWIGSSNDGIWVLNAEGSRIIKRFTKDNSPLFSNSIKSIAINDVTGEVFIATDVGLLSYQDVPKKAVVEMKDLKVYPNPFNYDGDSQLLIEGLSDETSVKVLGVDGTVVNVFETSGGRVSWDGRDFNGGKLGSGIYYVVAIDKNGNSKGVGKVVIVR
ncbi:MAG: two-component regulator propeller domain-containing protein [Balneola sp.]